MKNVKFIINSIPREKEIVKMTQKYLSFLTNEKIIFTLPKKDVVKEYDIKKYQQYKKYLEKEWAKKEKGFVKRLLTFFHQPLELQFIVEISNYGPLGFYNSSNNTVTINMNHPFDVTRTIKHEMVHIMVEPFVKKYSVSYQKKEHIVNIVMEILEQ